MRTDTEESSNIIQFHLLLESMLTYGEKERERSLGYSSKFDRFDGAFNVLSGMLIQGVSLTMQGLIIFTLVSSSGSFQSGETS